MRIKIVKDIDTPYANDFAKGMGMKNGADRKSFVERSRKQPSVASWFAVMDFFGGKWVEVETDHLFAAQFNIGDPDGFEPPPGRHPRTSGARVNARYVEEIDFSPEFLDVDDYLAAVQKRYDRDWPGARVSRELVNRVACGILKDVTPS